MTKDYQKEVFNDDICRIVGLDEQEQELLVQFEGQEVRRVRRTGFEPVAHKGLAVQRDARESSGRGMKQAAA